MTSATNTTDRCSGAILRRAEVSTVASPFAEGGHHGLRRHLNVESLFDSGGGAGTDRNADGLAPPPPISPARFGASKEMDHAAWVVGTTSRRNGFGRARDRTPDSKTHPSNPTTMSHHLSYSISKKTPPSSKVIKSILDAQSAVNSCVSWAHERLQLATPREVRPILTFPLRFGVASGPMTIHPEGLVSGSPMHATDSYAQGTTRVRDSLWNAHVVAAFWRTVSRMHPELLIELRDEGGFVIPGAVYLRGGNIEANRTFLNLERARALELSGDPQAGVPYIYAELHGLAGRFFVDMPVAEYEEVPEIQELGLSWPELEAVTLSEVAQRVVERAIRAPKVAVA